MADKQVVDPLDEVCPTCKAVPGHPCDLSVAVTPKQALGGGSTWHPARERKAVRRIKRQKARVLRLLKPLPPEEGKAFTDALRSVGIIK